MVGPFSKDGQLSGPSVRKTPCIALSWAKGFSMLVKEARTPEDPTRLLSRGACVAGGFWSQAPGPVPSENITSFNKLQHPSCTAGFLQRHPPPDRGAGTWRHAAGHMVGTGAGYDLSR